MMSIVIYKLVHFLGIFMLFLSLGGLILHAVNGGSKEGQAWRKPAAMTHGIGLFLVLLGGFGMLARLGISWPWPGWVWGKMVVWLLLGGILGVIYRKPEAAKALWFLVLLLGLGAAYLAGFKPF